MNEIWIFSGLFCDSDVQFGKQVFEASKILFKRCQNKSNSAFRRRFVLSSYFVLCFPKVPRRIEIYSLVNGVPKTFCPHKVRTKHFYRIPCEIYRPVSVATENHSSVEDLIKFNDRSVFANRCQDWHSLLVAVCILNRKTNGSTLHRSP